MSSAKPAIKKTAQALRRLWALESFRKNLSWRTLAFLDTFVLTFFLATHDPLHALMGAAWRAAKIALSEFATKSVLFWIHERVWSRIQVGKRATKEQRVRSLIKTVSWRVTGSADTMLLTFIFTGRFSIAVLVTSFEVVTKLVLFYLHERVWIWGKRVARVQKHRTGKK